MRALRMVSAVPAIAIANGCDSDSTLPTAPTDHSQHPVASVTVEPGTATLALGESTRFTATPECAHGVTLSRTVSWSASDAELVSLDADGTVEALLPGDVTLTATAGGVSAAAELSITGWFIGPAGGVATSGDGNVVMEVPAGALPTTTEIIIVPASADLLPSDPGHVPGTAYSCEPDRLQFRDHVRLRIHFDPADIPEGYRPEHLRLRHRERQRTQWEATEQNQLRTGESAFEGAIEHLSVYALVAMKDEAEEPSASDVGRIQILVSGSLDLEVGETATLVASVYDGAGDPRPEWKPSWRTEDAAVVDVDSDGVVTATGEGSARVFGSYGGKSESVTFNVSPAAGGGGGGGGGHEEGLGNNLSWPVIFTEGIGITGLPVATDPGLRPTAAEEIVVDALPFFYSGNVADYGAYFTQQSANVWQVEWLDASASGVQSATVYWGDNLTHQTWNTHSMIRVEHVLEAAGAIPLTGFNMTYLYGQGPDEMQGTDGTTGSFVPTMYSVVPRLTLQKLDAEGGAPVFTAFDGAVHEYLGVDGPGGYGAEVNVVGKVIYGYNFTIRNIAVPPDIQKYGWWRITFSLDDAATVGGVSVPRNVSIGAVGGTDDPELTYAPQFDPATNRTWLDIWVDSARGGGGGGGHDGG